MQLYVPLGRPVNSEETTTRNKRKSVKKTFVITLGNPSESMKSNETDKRCLHTQPDITPDEDEKAEEMIRASNIHRDVKSTAQNVVNTEETPNQIHLCDLIEVRKSPKSHQKSKIVVGDGKIKFCPLKNGNIFTNFGKHIVEFLAKK